MDKTEIIQKTREYVVANTPVTREPQKRYLDHVFGVEKYALLLGRELKADLFVLNMAALLHDIGADAGKAHAEESAKIAEGFLSGFNISEKEQIISCIRTHSMGSKTESIEEQIIQDADGLIFLEDTYEDFYTYHKNDGIKNFKDVILEKTRGMMKKIKTERGRDLAVPLLDKAERDIIKWTS